MLLVQLRSICPLRHQSPLEHCGQGGLEPVNDVRLRFPRCHSWWTSFSLDFVCPVVSVQAQALDLYHACGKLTESRGDIDQPIRV